CYTYLITIVIKFQEKNARQGWIFLSSIKNVRIPVQIKEWKSTAPPYPEAPSQRFSLFPVFSPASAPPQHWCRWKYRTSGLLSWPGLWLSGSPPHLSPHKYHRKSPG